LDEIQDHLHHDHAFFEFSFGRTFEKLIDFFLKLLTDLLLSTFLAYRAGDILDFYELGLDCRSAPISPWAALWAFPWHRVRFNRFGPLSLLPSIPERAASTTVPRG